MVGETTALNALGRCHCDIGQHDLARTEYLPTALKVAGEMGAPREACFSLAHLGLAHRELALYAEAQKYYQSALEIAEPIGHRQLETYCHGGLGKTDLALGDFTNALTHAETAVTLADEIKMKRAQQFWRTLVAQIFLFNQELGAAEVTAKEALSYDSEWVNYRTLTLQGFILAKLNQMQSAANIFQNASAEAKQVLSRTSTYFDARYFLAIATCGLAVAMPDESTTFLAQSTLAFEQAYQNCKSQGVVNEALRFLDELAALDTKVDLNGPRNMLKRSAS